MLRSPVPSGRIAIGGCSHSVSGTSSATSGPFSSCCTSSASPFSSAAKRRSAAARRRSSNSCLRSGIGRCQVAGISKACCKPDLGFRRFQGFGRSMASGSSFHVHFMAASTETASQHLFALLITPSRLYPRHAFRRSCPAGFSMLLHSSSAQRSVPLRLRSQACTPRELASCQLMSCALSKLGL